MILHLEVQANAQAEIDAVVGNDRWPAFSDRPSLPFCDTIMSETLRWGCPVPLSRLCSRTTFAVSEKVTGFQMFRTD
jgi:cytochrome P450